MRRATVLTAVGLVALLPASVADARIVPQTSIADVAVGDSTKEVKAELGAPDKIKNGMDDFGAFTRYSYDDPLVGITFKTGEDGLQVTSITSKGKGERTKSGVGVGSTEQEVKAGVEGETCKTFFEEFRSCYLGKQQAGRIVTDFSINTETGKVQRVVLGRVID